MCPHRASLRASGSAHAFSSLLFCNQYKPKAYLCPSSDLNIPLHPYLGTGDGTKTHIHHTGVLQLLGSPVSCILGRFPSSSALLPHNYCRYPLCLFSQSIRIPCSIFFLHLVYHLRIGTKIIQGKMGKPSHLPLKKIVSSVGSISAIY